MRDRERERERVSEKRRTNVNVREMNREYWYRKKVIRISVSPKIYSSILYHVVLQGYLLRYCQNIGDRYILKNILIDKYGMH